MEYNKFINYLKSISDNKYKEFNKKIIKTKYKMLGIKIPILRNIAKKIDKSNYEEFLNMVLIYHTFRDETLEDKKELKEDLSNIYEFERKELLLLKKSLLNEASDLNEEIEKQNKKLDLIKKINQYL